MDSSLELTDHYQLNRLVYVNSANHAYSEIMLNSNIALFGDNNVGKTASLAGMKLLLYPEVDFYGCETKFNFKGKNGLFSMEESYSFYFPDVHSFIVLEVNNPEGTFCMVLYKRNDFAYGRIFIPVDFVKLRAQFWDENNATFSENISIQSVRDFADKHDGIHLSDSTQIASLMYDGYRQHKDKQRFCVLPLKDDSKESILAFRSIYQLAFEVSNLDDKTLPNAIATLLEMNRGRSQEKLDADLNKLSTQHSELHSKGNWLQKLSNSEQLFNRVDDDYEQLNHKVREYSILYQSLRSGLEVAKANYATNFSAIDSDYKLQKVALDEADNKLKDLSIANRDKSTKLNVLGKQIKSKSDELTKAKALRAGYGDTPESQILSWLETDLSKARKKLDGYRSEDKTKQSLQENIQKRNELIAEIKKIKGAINDFSLSLFNQLNNDASASVLNSLNSGFSFISKVLTADVRNIINQFTELFDEYDGKLFFLSEPLGDSDFKVSNPAIQIEQLEIRIKRKQIELDEINADIEEQTEALKNENLGALIQQKSEEVEEILQEKNAISGLATLEKDVTSLKKEVEETDAQLLKDKDKFEKDTQSRNALAEAFQKIADTRAGMIDLNNSFVQIKNYLNSAYQNMQPAIIDAEPLDGDLLTIEYAESVLTEATRCNQAFNRFIQSFSQLERELPHPDLEKHKQRTSLSDFELGIQCYKSSYATLKYDQQQYRDEVRSHNHRLTNQLNELREAKSFLTNFVAEINNELNLKPISNLSEIKLHLDLNTSFLSLIDTADKLDIQDDSLIDASFYEALSRFVERHFNKQRGRLKMKDLIDKVKYHYQLKSNEKWVTKSQSGGTTTAITATVLSVLLKRLSPEYIALQMPIIVDEISVMDSDNTDSTLKQIMEHGFSIFCATPSFSASLSEKVGNWVMIDQSTISQPMVSDCHFNVMPEHIESFGAI